MKPIYQRILAILVMCIPGVIGVIGITWMRDILFNYFAGQGFAWLPFLVGLAMLLFSLYVIGGFIYYRDKKRNKIQPKLLRKKEKIQSNESDFR